MKIRHTILISLTLGLTSLPSAFGCELHGGGFGYSAYDANWLPYYEQGQSDEYKDEKQYSTMSDMIDDLGDGAEAAATAIPQSQQRARPSFSSSATRASNTAKSRLSEDTSWQTAQTATANITTDTSR
ncbi:MAG: hypothetical protein ABJG15_05300 [Hyphomonadaceae bacterium]